MEMNSHTKKMTQNTRKRKATVKKECDKFILDQEGESRPAKSLSVNRIKAEDTLGYDPLIKKER